MKWLLSLCFALAALSGLIAAAGDPNDPKKWTPIRIRGQQKAPEFADITEWLNSQPIKMADLKGKVVVIHFMAHG